MHATKVAVKSTKPMHAFYIGCFVCTRAVFWAKIICYFRASCIKMRRSSVLAHKLHIACFFVYCDMPGYLNRVVCIVILPGFMFNTNIPGISVLHFARGRIVADLRGGDEAFVPVDEGLLTDFSFGPYVGETIFGYVRVRLQVPVLYRGNTYETITLPRFFITLVH